MFRFPRTFFGACIGLWLASASSAQATAPAAATVALNSVSGAAPVDPPRGTRSPFSPDPWTRTPLPDVTDEPEPSAPSRAPDDVDAADETDRSDTHTGDDVATETENQAVEEQSSRPRSKKSKRRGGSSRSRSRSGKSQSGKSQSGKSQSRSSSRSAARSRLSDHDDEDDTHESAPPSLSSSRAPNDKRCHYQSPLHKHTVLPGEHLGQIAGRYGVNRAELVELNGQLKNPDRILPGQEILVCPDIAPRELVASEYKVKSGDTLVGIAKAHDLTLSELMGFQSGKLTDPNRIRVGQTLKLWTQGEIVADFLPRRTKRSGTRGKLSSGQKLAAAGHYHLRRPHNAYGTARTVSLLRDVFAGYHKRSRGGPRIVVGDLSKQGGGPLKGHASHQRGVDVDVGLVLKGPQTQVSRFVNGSSSNLDVERTWLLVHEFLRTGEVRYIFLDYSLQKLLYEHAKKSGVPESKLDEYFQYPRSIRRSHGIIRHWRGHRDHLHVRFRG